MRVSKVAVAAVVGLQIVVSAASAGDGSDPGANRSDDQGESGTVESGSGQAPAAPASSTASHSGPVRHRSQVSRHRSRTSWQVGFGWGGWGRWGPGWGWDPYWYGPGWGYTTVYPNPAMRHGALDLDVSPERAEIWLDGRRIGVADDFDGFPDLLWLEKGTYDVAIYLPGFRTIARQYTIYPGLVIDVEDRLEQGESIHPDDLVSKSHVRRDERLRRDRQAQEEAQAEARRARGDDEGWSPRSREESLDARDEPARIRLEVTPDDASVYLDGRFLGTGRDLSRLRAGLLIDPGMHTLEVVRPGYESTRRSIEVAAGSEQEVEIELETGD